MPIVREESGGEIKFMESGTTVSIFNKLLGKKKPSKPTPTASNSSNLANDPNLVRAFDAYGREIFITKEEWRTNVLPGSIESNWNNADALYNVIVGALTDGFRAEVIEAVSHLYEIDPHPDRGACIWGIVLMEETRLDEAENVFRKFLNERGANGTILTNLAKVYSKRNDNAKAEEILWQALEHDPNQDNGLMWYYAIHCERSGDAGASTHSVALPRCPEAGAPNCGWLGTLLSFEISMRRWGYIARLSIAPLNHPLPIY